MVLIAWNGTAVIDSVGSPPLQRNLDAKALMLRIKPVASPLHKSRMLLYIKGKKNGRMMLESIENGPLVYPTIEENDAIRPKKYAKLIKQEKLQMTAAKDIWDRVNLLMKGTELSYQERKCKLYNEFDKFTSDKVQVNTKFLNALQPKWSKFVTDVKLAKNLYTTNYDQLYAYLSQHEGHANEARMLRERYPDPLALVANYQTQSNSSQYPQQLSSTPQQAHSSQPCLPTYEAPHHPQQYQHAFQAQLNHTPPSVPQNDYHTPPISQQPQAEFLQLDLGLVVPSFLPGDDPIACLNKAMAFMVTVQQVQGRQGQSFAGTGTKGNATSSRGNNVAGQARVVKCYNYQVLDEEQLAFLAEHGVADGQATQTTITHNVAFQTDDLDAYDLDCDDISLAKAVRMANLSSYDSDVLSKVPQHDTYQNDDMINQSVQETHYFEQFLIDYIPDNEITSDSNIISYEQYLQETQNAIVQDTNSFAQQDAMIIFMFEQMSNQVTNYDMINKENKLVNESLTAELERYNERVKTFEQIINIDLSSRENFIDLQMDDMIRNRNALKQEIESLK
ncbi:hypothetical protein Tco_1316689 [Tanacetum coccineum]